MPTIIRGQNKERSNFPCMPMKKTKRRRRRKIKEGERTERRNLKNYYY